MRWIVSLSICWVCTLDEVYVTAQRVSDTTKKPIHLDIRATARNPRKSFAAILLAFDPAGSWLQASTGSFVRARHFATSGHKLLSVVPRSSMSTVMPRSSVSQASVATSEKLIPRDVIFSVSYSTATMSPDGRLLVYQSTDDDGQLQLWRRTVGQDDDRVISTNSYRGGEVFPVWAEDSKTLLFLVDAGGTEILHLMAVDVTQTTSVVRDLSPDVVLEGNSTVVKGSIRTNKRFPGQVLIDVAGGNPDVYRCDLANGECVLDTENPGHIGGWFVDDESFTVCGAYAHGEESTTLWVQDPGAPESDWRKFDIFSDEASETHLKMSRDDQLQILTIAKDRKSVLALSSLYSDTKALVRLDLQSGELETIASHDKCDCENVVIDEETKEVRMVSFNFARQEYVFFDEEWEADFRRLEAAGPQGSEVQICFAKSTVLDDYRTLCSQSRDQQTWLVAYHRDNGPREYAIYERATGKTSRLFSEPAQSDYTFARMEDVRIKARDGLELVAYLTRADASKATPLVLLVHGGPCARDDWGFNDEVQWLASRGYAVLQVNFRGSRGYGKAFEQKGWGQWGADLQHDLSDAVAWAIGEGIALADKVCIMGHSYGGYATLAGLAFTPDLYRCGVASMGIANVRTWCDAVGITPEHPRLERWGNVFDDEFNKKISPLFHLSNIKSPLFVAHGENDPRVPQEQSDQIAFEMRSRNLPVEYVKYLGEGHQYSMLPNKADFHGRVEQFLAEHLGGRADPFETPEGSSAVLPLSASEDRKGELFDLNLVPDQTGRLRIHHAALNGNMAELEAVIAEAPATIKIPDQYGRSPIHYAAVYGQVAVAKKLLAADPDLTTTPDEAQRLPIHYAAESGHAAVVELLGAAAGVTMKKPERMGRMPIHLAAIAGHAEVVEYLAEAAPETAQMPATDGYSPSDYASFQGHSTVVDLLNKFAKVTGGSTSTTPKKTKKSKSKGTKTPSKKGFR